MAIHNLITGDKIAIPVTLKKNGALIPGGIDPAAQVRARIISRDHATAYSVTVTQNSTAAGADWLNSLVIIEFAPADTSAITVQGLALIEIEVVDAGETRTWFVMVNLIKGQIT